MTNNEDIKWLYGKLIGQGYDIGTEEEFTSSLSNSDDRDWYYKKAIKMGLDVGSKDEFDSLFAPHVPTPEAKVTQTPQAPEAPSAPKVGSLNWYTAETAGDAVKNVADNSVLASATKAKNTEATDNLAKVKGTADVAQNTQGLIHTTPIESKALELAQFKAKNKAMFDSMAQRTADMVEYYTKAGANVGKVVETAPKYNTETGEFETQYITPTLNRENNKAIADAEAREYKQMQKDVAIYNKYFTETNMTTAAQLRSKRARLADVERKISERIESLQAEQEQLSGGVMGFINELGRGSAGRGIAKGVYTQDDETAFALDEEYKTLRAIKNQLEEQIQKLENKQDNEQNGTQPVFDFLKGTAQNLFAKNTFDFGRNSLNDSRASLNINDKIARGEELTDTEEQLIYEQFANQLADEYIGDLGKGLQYGHMTGDIAGFAIDMALMGPGGSSGGAVAKGLTNTIAKILGVKTTEGLAKKLVERGLFATIKNKGAVGKLLSEVGIANTSAITATRALGIGAEYLAIKSPIMTVTQQGAKAAGKIIETKLGDVELDYNTGELRYANDKGFGKATYEALGDQIIENASEMIGGHLPGISNVTRLGSRGLTASVLRATREGAGTVISKVNQFLGKVGVHSVFDEISEEYIGQAWRTIFRLESAKGQDGNNNLLNAEFHSDIWCGMGASIGFMHGIGLTVGYGAKGVSKVMSSVEYQRLKHQVNKASAYASSIIPAEQWDNLQTLIDAADNVDISNVAEQIAQNKDLTDRQKDAAMNYINRLMIMRGFNLAKVFTDKAGVTMDADAEAVNQSYVDGYESNDAQEMADARKAVEVEEAKLRSALSGIDQEGVNAIMANVVADPVTAMQRAEDEALRDAIADYANAKAVYDGMQQRVGDDIDTQIAVSDATIDRRTNRNTGKVQSVTLKNDKKVYVVGGTLNTTENGSVDFEHSDESIIVMDETGALEYSSPKNVLSIDNEIDPVEEKTMAAETIRQQAQAQAEANMSGKLTFTAGEQVNIKQENGTFVNGTIVGPYIEDDKVIGGLFEVETQDGIKLPFKTDVLQSWVDEARQARVEQFDAERQAQRDAIAEQQAALEAEAPVAEEETKPLVAEFNQDDVFTIDINGEDMSGTVLAPINDDGLVEVLLNTPNGEVTQMMTPDVLNVLLTSYNGVSLASEEAPIAEGATTLPEVEATEVPEVMEEPQSALDRVPKDAKGEPMYEAVDAETAWDALLEQTEGDAETAQMVAEAMVEDKTKALEKVEKSKSKGGTTVTEKIAAEKERKANIAKAQQELDAWKAIASVQANRQQAYEEIVAAEEARRAKAEEAPIVEVPVAEPIAEETETNQYPAPTRSEDLILYHGTPFDFDVFDANEIGTAEGGSKGMIGINLSEESGLNRSPKFANIKSEDAPMHLGVARPTNKEVSPRILTVSGKDLNLYDAKKAKGLNQAELVAAGYDGVRLQSPSQITIFPESIHKLNIEQKQTIEEFIASHPEVEKWAPWTTNEERRIAAENRAKQTSDAVNFSVNDAKGKGKKNTAVTESTDQFSADASSGSLVQSAHHSPTATLSVPSDHAKLDNKTQKIKKNIRKFKNGDAHIKTNGGIKTTLNDLRKFFGMDYKGNSNYVTFNTPYGTMTLRIAEHNAKGDNFARDNSAMNVSVYIARNEYEQPESSVPFDEYRISEEDFNNNKEDFVKSLIESVDDALTTGEFTQPRHTEKVVEDGAKLWNMANAQAKANAEAVEAKRVEAIKETAQRWSKKLGAKVQILESIDDVKNKQARQEIENAEKRGTRVRAWYGSKNGVTYVYLPHIVDEQEVSEVMAHEIVAHKGLKGLLGEEGYSDLCERVFYNVMTTEQQQRFLKYPGVNGNKAKAADEFIAHLAEAIDVESQTAWQKFVDMLRVALEKLAEAVTGKGKEFAESFTNAEHLQSLLRESYRNMAKESQKMTESQMRELESPVSVKNDGTLSFSMTTYHDWTDSNGVKHQGTRDMVIARMQEKNFTENQIKEMTRKMDTAYDYMRKLETLTDENGRVRFDEFVEWAKSRPYYKQVGKDYVKAITSLVNNGDYPINLELTTDCIKREAYTKLLNEMVKRGADLSQMGPGEIVTIQKMMKQYGIEVACELCFVEGKRLQIVNWAQQIVDDWNTSLNEAGFETDEEFRFGKDGEEFIPVEDWETYKDKTALRKAQRILDEVGLIAQGLDPASVKAQKEANDKAVLAYMKEKRDAWAKRTKKDPSKWTPSKEQRRVIKKLQIEGMTPSYVVENMNEYREAFDRMRAQWVEKNPKKDVMSFTPTKKQWEALDKIRNKQISDVKQKMIRLIMEYPEMRKKMSLNDLLGSKGLMDIRQQHGEAYDQLYSIILQRFGTGTPKPVQDAVPYDGEVMGLSETDYNKANKIGGARLFSFSDFDITKTFDYMQMFFDLEANKQKLQSYTKEIAAILIFGRSNAKMNISTLAKATVPESVKAEYKEASEEQKKELRHKWAENAGLIVDENGNIVGINFSEEHSVKPEFAKAIFHDAERNKNCGAIMVGASVNHAIYSAMQNWIRMVIPFHLSGMPIAAREKTDVLWYTDNTAYQSTRKRKEDGWTKIDANEDTFSFYDDMDKPGWNMRDKARQYLEWCEANGYRPKFDWGINSQKYIEYCEENGYTPNQQLIEAMDADTVNGVWNQYYKFLTDFTAYQPVFNEHGEMIDEIPSPQLPIETNFDMSEVEKQVLFEADDSILAHRESNIDKTNEHIAELADKAEQYLSGNLSEEDMGFKEDEFYENYADAERYLREFDEEVDQEVSFSIREAEAPKKTRTAYAAFCVMRDAKTGAISLQPKMINDAGVGAPPLTWLNADTGTLMRDKEGNIKQNTRGRAAVKNTSIDKRGKRTSGGELAWRPGKHLAEYPNASQFAVQGEGSNAKDKMQDNIVFFEVEYSADVDYQLDAWSYGVNKNGKYEHTQAGLPYIPYNGYYYYRTNANPDVPSMIICGAYKIKRALTDAEAKQLNEAAGGQWLPRYTEGYVVDEAELSRLGLDKEGMERMAENFPYDRVNGRKDESDLVMTLPGYVARDLNFDDKDLQEAIRENVKIQKGVTFEEELAKYRAEWEERKAQSDAEGLATDEYAKRKFEEEYQQSVEDEDVSFSIVDAVEEMVEDAKGANEEQLEAKQNAIAALGGDLGKLRSAMARQRKYDKFTIEIITRMAKEMLDNGMLGEMSHYAVKRLLGAIERVHGKQDVSKEVNSLINIMIDTQLQNCAASMAKMLKVKGSKVNATGVQVQGVLDADGEAMVKAFKRAIKMQKEDIEERLTEVENRMQNANEVVANDAKNEYYGLQLALQYMEEIKGSKAEEVSLRRSLEDAKSDRDAGMMTQEGYRQYVKSVEDAIQQNKMERAEAYRTIMAQLGGLMGESIERAKAWREAEAERVNSIHHYANSDMEGRKTNEHRKDTFAQKFMSFGLVKILLSPYATFDQMLRMFGKKNVRGEGYLYRHFMDGWMRSTENEYTGYRDALKELDAKAKEVFGDKAMRWGHLIKEGNKPSNITVDFWDGGEIRPHTLTVGNLLYIYMVNKMADGQMKLRHMGITEEQVDAITRELDPEYIALADWLQETFLTEKREKYNEVHKRMFGTSMASIDNYFPLKILANARTEKVDVGEETPENNLPSTATGSIIKRKKNNTALDVMGTNAFAVILDHLNDMEHWAAFAEFNRDLNTLLSYKRFRNQVLNMNSTYGGGKELWQKFKDACAIAAGSYRAKTDPLDAAALKIAKGASAAKVAWRTFTALKQFSSLPAFVQDANAITMAKNIANPYKAWNWTMQNLPIAEKRWKSMVAGDPKLLQTMKDWDNWQSRISEVSTRYGMLPNAFVDAVSVSIGAYSVYEAAKKRYLRYGYSEEQSEQKAKNDATTAFNQTQQSGETAFLSAMQVDRTWLSTMLSVFRNNAFAFGRQLHDAFRGLGRSFNPNAKEFMAKQMMRQGLSEEQAEKAAEKEIGKSRRRDLVRLFLYGGGLTMLWEIMSAMPYLLFGDDDDEKDEIIQTSVEKSLLAGFDGLAGGDGVILGLQWALYGEGKLEYAFRKDMPFISDVESMIRKFSSDELAALNDLANIVVQWFAGVNPQVMWDAMTGVWDYCEGDAQTAREVSMLMMNILACPQSQRDKVYLDEIDLSVAEASKLTPEQIAERYARYKVRRTRGVFDILSDRNNADSVLLRHKNKALKEYRGKLDEKVITEDTRKLLDEHTEVRKLRQALNDLQDSVGETISEEEYQARWVDHYNNYNPGRYKRVGIYKREANKLWDKLKKTEDPEEKDSLINQAVKLRDVMLKDIREIDKEYEEYLKRNR